MTGHCEDSGNVLSGQWYCTVWTVARHWEDNGTLTVRTVALSLRGQWQVTVRTVALYCEDNGTLLSAQWRCPAWTVALQCASSGIPTVRTVALTL